MATQTYSTIYAVEFVDGAFHILDYFNDAYPYTISEPGDGVVTGGDPLAVSLHVQFTFTDPDTGEPIEFDETQEFDAVYVGATPYGVIFEYNGDYSLLTNQNDLVEGPVLVDEGAYIVCFLAGVRIATPLGDRAIETLAPGDLVLTHDGRAAPVKWLWVQTVSTFFADPLRVAPVRVRAGALGENLPARDLLVSTDHGLWVNGALVQAGALVNGRTITREAELPERFCYFHVELQDHSLILAEGVPAETFLDAVGRRAFDNWRAYEAVHGHPAAMAEMDLPRIKSARQARRAA
jgi:hypothetical protein